MRRGVLVRLVAVGLAAAAVASAVAFFVPWLPTPASKQADRIDFVFWFVTGISIAIFALVVAVILYSVLRFRARPDDDSDGAPIHGNTTLEIAWTAVPAVLVTAVAVVSAVALAENGTQGLARIDRKPDLVVVDLMMPNLNGYDFVKQLRSMDGQTATPVIAASGLSTGEWALKAGADRFLPKPFRSGELMALVDELLSSGGGAAA